MSALLFPDEMRQSQEGGFETRPYISDLFFCALCAAQFLRMRSGQALRLNNSSSYDRGRDESRPYSYPNFAPLRLGAFAGDIPRLTGARSAPYENLRVLRAFVVKNPFLVCALYVLCGKIPI
jgi:hypothetical protein